MGATKTPCFNTCTHTPRPKKRVRHLQSLPLFSPANAAALREQTANGFAGRGLPGLAAAVRRGDDPLALPSSLVLPALVIPDPKARTRRDALNQQTVRARRDLTRAYQAQDIAGTLQELLLVNRSGDPRWIFEAARAYAVQESVENLYARTLRTLRLATPAYDTLLTLAPPDAARGEGELMEATDAAQSAIAPLTRAANAVALALLDLTNNYLRPRGNSEPWLRAAAQETTLRYGESELARADSRSGRAWRLLALAQIRGLSAQMNGYVPAGDARRRAIWERLLAGWVGSGVARDAASQPKAAGEATVRAALAKETGKSGDALEAARGTTEPLADWVLSQRGDAGEYSDVFTAFFYGKRCGKPKRKRNKAEMITGNSKPLGVGSKEKRIWWRRLYGFWF